MSVVVMMYLKLKMKHIAAQIQVQASNTLVYCVKPPLILRVDYQNGLLYKQMKFITCIIAYRNTFCIEVTFDKLLYEFPETKIHMNIC